MTQLYKSFLLVCLLISTTITAQNKYMFSTGVSMPDNISDKYLRPGIFLGYAIDFKIYKNLFINTGLSISFNNKNKTYTFGFDDEPLLKDIPYIREDVLMDIENTRLYLF